jgi:hypothetical protein
LTTTVCLLYKNLPICHQFKHLHYCCYIFESLMKLPTLLVTTLSLCLWYKQNQNKRTFVDEILRANPSLDNARYVNFTCIHLDNSNVAVSVEHVMIPKPSVEDTGILDPQIYDERCDHLDDSIQYKVSYLLNKTNKE